ncbi:P protein-like [Lycorma delicatula]|uniref:P protein-like n=1 Tax=Lycorma delicatula TaxID=130591 RepID=UPI003F51A14F
MQHPIKHQITLELEGAILPLYYGNLSQRCLTVWAEFVQTKQTTQLNSTMVNNKNVIYSEKITKEWIVPLVSEEIIDIVPAVRRRHLFDVYNYNFSSIPQGIIRFQFKTNLAASFPISFSLNFSPIDPSDGVIYALLVLLGLYVLIIFEIVHRTIAAISAAIISIAILAALDERPTKMELVTWIDVETLLLLSSMMVLVAILSKSGVFDYLAVLVYKTTSGQVWPLINTLCIFTALLSSFLDSVTTALLMTPVSIRLCEVMELNPVPILMAMIMYSNIGGAMTPVGDPPNVILAMNEDVINAGVNFYTFVCHTSIPLIIVMLCVNILLRYMFRNMNVLRFAEPQDVQELRHEITVWRRAAASLSYYSKDEDAVRLSLLKKVRLLLKELKTKLHTGSVQFEKYIANLEELQDKYPIRDKWLLLKSSVALLFVIMMFFLHSIPKLNLSMGWAALLGALLLLFLADEENFEGVLARLEWGTLIFFGALFILMEALSRLGLIEWIGSQTEEIILSVSKEYRLATALLLILWVSGLASSFVDNIPLTTMMVKIITRLSQKEGLELPLQPLVWALVLGACLGGNGTLIGASSNVVCAGVAEQHGYRFTFMQFLRMGFPVTILSMIVATIYLMVTHVWLEIDNV